MPTPNEEPTKPTNIDEIDSIEFNSEDSDESVNCPESPTGEHEFDTDAELDPSEEIQYCVYCKKQRD